MGVAIESLDRKSPLNIQPWLISPTTRIFNTTLALWDGKTYSFSRQNPYDVPEKYSDVTKKYAVYVEDRRGNRKTGEVSVREIYEPEGFVSMEDWRCGKTQFGENWVGVSLVRDEGRRGGSNLLIPYPGVARVNLKDPRQVVIQRFIPLDDIGPAKNTLVLLEENGNVTIADRREGRAFDHSISFHRVNISSGKTTHISDEQIPKAPWCRDRIGLTGLPVDLPPESGQRSNQLWVLHGVKKTPRIIHDDYEYSIGLGIRTETQRGRVDWRVTEKALYTHAQIKDAIGEMGIIPEDRDPNKKVVYSTGVLRTKGYLFIALAFGDWATFKLVERTSDLVEAAQRSELIGRAA